MSPVARRSSGAHTGRALAVALAGVLLAFGIGWAAVNYASSNEAVEIRLGDDRFEAGDAADIADDIAERGAPLAFADVATGRRPIWLDHLGNDPEEGWVAFGAFVPDDPDCSVNWILDDERYEACDGQTFPRTGDGLRTFPVTVEDGDLFVDLRPDAGS